MDLVSDKIPTSVIVKNPIKHGEGYKSFVLYTVKCTAPDSSNMNVKRRYSDFVWLRERLFTTAPGAFIPPLPAKSFFGRFAEEFVERRRRGLEVFLKQLLRHDVLRLDKTLHLFLSASRSGLEVEQNSQKSRWKALKARYKNIRSKVEKTENDERCERIQEFSLRLEASLRELTCSIARTQRNSRSLSESWYDIGLGFYTLAEFGAEKNLRGLADVSARFASAAYDHSCMIRTQEEVEGEKFEEPVAFNAGLVIAIQRVLKNRQLMLQTWSYESVQLDKLYETQSKLTEGEKRIKCQEKIVDQENIVRAAEENLLEQTDRIFKEFSRFQEEFEVDVLDILIGCATRHYDNTSQACDFWRNVIKELELKKSKRGGGTFDLSRARRIPKRPSSRTSWWAGLSQFNCKGGQSGDEQESNTFPKSPSSSSSSQSPPSVPQKREDQTHAWKQSETKEEEETRDRVPERRTEEEEEILSRSPPNSPPPTAPQGQKEPQGRADSRKRKGLMSDLLKWLDGDEEALNSFRTVSVSYRRGNIDAEGYFSKFLTMFGPETAFGTNLFGRIVDTLPDKDQQRNLLTIYNRESCKNATSNAGSPNNRRNSPVKSPSETAQSKEQEETLRASAMDVYRKQHRREKDLQDEEELLRIEIAPLVQAWIVKSGKVNGKYGNIYFMMSDLYSIFPHFSPPDQFRIANTAAQSQLKKTYHNVCKVIHPDKHTRSVARKRVLASCVFAAVSEAYSRHNNQKL